MLCSQCRRQVTRGAGSCGACGAPARGAIAPPTDVVLEDGTRVAVIGELTIGRAAGNDLRLDDPSVSRRHARIRAGGGDGAWLEDVASSHGTWVDDARVEGPLSLRDGARIQVGNRFLVAERRRETHEAGRTMVVPVGASLVLQAAGGVALESAEEHRPGQRPRLRSGHRVKRLEAEAGAARWVVEDLESGVLVRLDDTDGSLLALLDGATPLTELVVAAEGLLGAAGPARLARLLAELGERGLLAGVAAGRGRDAEVRGWRRLVRPRDRTISRIAPAFEALYRRGGWLLFTRPALVLFALVAAFGLVAEVVLIGWRYGSPLIVASHLGLGGLVFLGARGLLVALHETAHGLTLASFGRRVNRAGLRLVLVFPYAFVGTSESWFEPKRHRLAITLAGPVSDLVLGGAFAITCLVLQAGTTRDVFFQLAFAAYVGALFNLNPFLDRDGYHVLVDVLGRPKLRERARTEFARRLSGGGRGDDDPALGRFALAGVGWSLVAAGIAITLSLRYASVMERYVPETVVWVLLGTLGVGLFVPAVITVGGPLWKRRGGARG